ncbi:MAG: hypothetical protein IKA47_06370 [Oscillospiraceae bacterium]|nr:hypothetical protein [Oscillospiraceae bacterium]
MKKQIAKAVCPIFIAVILVLSAIFLIGRYGWKLGGFRSCESAGVAQIQVEEDHIRILGFYPGSFPQGFLGYYAEQEGSTLYVGFKFSSLFGLFETGDFDITIPTKGTVTHIVVKSGQQEITVWPKEETLTDEAEVTENGLSAYEPIVLQYRTALEENWSGQQLVDADMNFMVQNVPPETVGYAVEDLDGNGTPELIIGTNCADVFYEKMVFLLYTVGENGEPVQLFSSIERNRYYFAGGSRFANLGSSSADSSFATTWKLEGEELVDMTCTTDPKDYVQMALTPIV